MPVANNSLSPFGGALYQSFTANGVPNNGGKLSTFLAGTNTAKTTYTDAAGAVPNPNPIILNADGRPPDEIWLDNASVYKFVLTDANNNLLETRDNIYPPGNSVAQYGPGFFLTLSTTGWQRLPSGLLIQWKPVAYSVGGDVLVTWPTPFLTSVLGVWTSIQTTSAGAFASYNTQTLTSVNVAAWTATGSRTSGAGSVFAIGV